MHDIGKIGIPDHVLLRPGGVTTDEGDVMPMLGVPLWWPANEDPTFYQDASMFRLPRTNAALVCEPLNQLMWP